MKEIMKELNVEKLNICEADGSIKLSLFNSQNIPSLILENEDLLPGHRSKDGVSGLMFYNNEGDECGGLIYGSNVDSEGNIDMGMSLTFDKFKQDQVLQLHLQKQNELEQYGISIYDRPSCSIRTSLDLLKTYHKESNETKKQETLKELQKDNQKRIFVGHDFDGETKISLYNKKGQEKIKFFIDNNGEAAVTINGKTIDINNL